MPKKRSTPQQSQECETARDLKNRPLRIPLGFDAAVEGLLNTKPKRRKGGKAEK